MASGRNPRYCIDHGIVGLEQILVPRNPLNLFPESADSATTIMDSPAPRATSVAAGPESRGRYRTR